MEANINITNNENDFRLSGDLQEVYTDLDAWINKWCRKFKQRSPHLCRFPPESGKTQSTAEEVKCNNFVDLFFYGILDKTNMATNYNSLNSKLMQTEDNISLDYVIFKLFLTENRGRRILLVNSKL